MPMDVELEELAFQPRCCGVVMRDRPGEYVCPACRSVIALPPVQMPSEFVGRGIRGG